MAISEKPSIAIVGGGLAGLTLSIGLTRHGIAHTIYESASKFAEIGAGIALGPNSITALELIDPRTKDALKRCVTYNEGVDENGDGLGKEEWLDVRIGDKEGFNELITTVCHQGKKPGRACVHRARFLEELIKLIPPSTALFNKSLTAITSDPSSDILSMSFADGTTASASAIIACDGIKSVARQQYVLVDVGDTSILRPAFANEFAYRGMFTRAEFLEITGGALNVGKGSLFCAPDSYVVMYPVEKGSLMNMVAIKRIAPPAPNSEFSALIHESNWVQPVTGEAMLADFDAWGGPIKALLSKIQHLERWALYDHLPAPTYVKGLVALMGDAAHATTPHQGQGAGMAFEDSLVLSEILGDVLNGAIAGEDVNRKLEACLRAYDEVRRPRAAEMTRTSREMGGIIGYVGDGIGRDLVKLKANLDGRMNWVWDVDLVEEVRRGIEIVREDLNHASSSA